jgi:hypothetical protein
MERDVLCRAAMSDRVQLCTGTKVKLPSPLSWKPLTPALHVERLAGDDKDSSGLDDIPKGDLS